MTADHIPAIVILGDADWGFIPGMLDINDPRPAREQFNDRNPGGWHGGHGPPGLRFDADSETLHYPGDPVQHPIGALMFRHELLLLFPGSFVVILQRDGSWEIQRMD
jgi:hypothetical protein